MLALAKPHEKRVFVRKNDETKKLIISFNYENQFIANRLFTLERRQNELIEVSLSRLQSNITGIALKKFLKKQKLKKSENCDKKQEEKSDDLTLNVAIEDANGTVLESGLENHEAFQTGNKLIIDGTKYQIIVDAPTVIRLSLPKVIMSGFPILAYATLENADPSDCVFSWWRNSSSLEKKQLERYKKNDIIKLRHETWQRIPNQTSQIFEPRKEDVGRLIMVICEPRREAVAGVEVYAVSPSTVVSPKNKFPFEERHLLTTEVLPADQFRVVSYNLLANAYASTDYSKKVLFNYCPADALDFEYRKHVLIKELQGYNGDVLCLQEVDSGMFRNELQPQLRKSGLEGIFGEKEAQSSEGCAVFFRTSKFILVESSSDVLSQALHNESCLEDLRLIVERNEKLRTRFMERGTIVQRVLLRHVESGRELLICNTHLYFHPDADHIRLLQAFTALRLAEHQLTKIDQQSGTKSPMIFCGDFNSCPEFGVYKLFTTGKAPHTLEDWRSNEEESVNGLTATIQRTFSSACGTPDYTNYTVGFNGCLDYIFHSKELSVTSVVPLPPHDVVAHPKYLAIPSPMFPSDHLALVASFRFNE